MIVRLAADIQPDSILDGSGIRTVIWFQGCLHKCEGCQNPETHDMNGGFEIDTKDICEKLQKDFDFILVDCPAGIEQGFQNAVAGASEAIVVTTPEVSSIRDADRIIGLLEANEIGKTELIVNRLRMDMVRRGDMMAADDVGDILAIPLIGIIPDDENVVIATNQGEPLVGNDTPAGKAYYNVVERLRGREIPFLDFEKGMSFWTKVTGIFRKV